MNRALLVLIFLGGKLVGANFYVFCNYADCLKNEVKVPEYNTSIFQCFQGSRGERVAATSCPPPLQTFTVSSLPILSFRAPWLVGGCPNDLSLDWGARRIEAPRGWTSYGVGRIDLWLPYKDRLTFLSTVIFKNISHRSTGEIWSLKLRVTTLIRPTRKVQM